MDEMWRLGMPWWHVVARGVAVYGFLLLALRLSGKRTVGQYTPFDLLVLVILGDAVQNAMIGDEMSLTGGFILVATLLALNWLVGYASARSNRVDHVLEGSPVLLARDGRVFENVMRQQNLNDKDLEEAMRAADCASREDIALAMRATGGKISVVNRDGSR